MPGPLAGSLNALSAPQYDDPGGLVIPGGNPGGPYVPRPPQREYGLNEILGKLGGMAGATLDVPRLMAYNLGPALVGRPGQGPQTGAELLGRLGLDPNSPTQRAIGHGGGAALDMLANPINLLTMGGGGAAANRVAGPLTSRLEAMAGEGLAGRLAGNPATGSIAGMEQGSLLNPRFSPSMSPFAGRQPYTAAEMIAERAGMAPRTATPPPITPRTDFAALRSEQLNSPSFNPSLPAPGLGTPSFSQESPASNLLNRLQRMATPSTSENATVADRLQRFAQPPASTPQPFDPIRANVENFNRAGSARPPNPEASQLPALPGPPRGQFGPPMFPEGLNVAPGGLLPTSRPEYSPDQFRAFYQAMQNPGRGSTLGPRSPTLPSGPIDY